MTEQRFYNTHAETYFKQTVQVDSSPFLSPLTKHLKPRATIMDIGCGSGRDILWLKKKGFSCLGLEKSPNLAALARKHTKTEIMEADFELFDFSKLNMDAILLIGALVHVPKEKFPPVFKHLLHALEPKGLVLITMKQGKGSQPNTDGRLFYLWEKPQLERVFKELNLICLDYSTQSSQIRESDTWMGFLLQKN